MSTYKQQELDELFHQPVRLEIMAELCSSAEGHTFTDLRERCNLTDGNLSRHLQALAEANAVKIKKTFVRAKPLTTVMVTNRGRDSFLSYLETLEKVLHDAASRAKSGSKEQLISNTGLKPARS